MLTTDLSQVGALVLVERTRLQALRDEIALGDAGYLDPAMAARAGRGIGATWVLTGAFATVDPEMRIVYYTYSPVSRRLGGR